MELGLHELSLRKRGKGGHHDLLRVRISDASPYPECKEQDKWNWAYSHYPFVNEAKVVITTYSGYALQMLVPTSDIRTKIGDFKSK